MVKLTGLALIISTALINSCSSQFVDMFSYLQDGVIKCDLIIGDQEFNFSSITESIATYNSGSEEDTSTYFLSFCRPIPSINAEMRLCNQQNSSVCEIEREGEETMAHSIVAGDGTCTVQFIDKSTPAKGIEISCNNGSSEGCNSKRSLFLNAICNSSAEGLNNFEIMHGIDNQTCEFFGNVESSAFCPHQHKKPLSTFLIVLIILSVLLALYIIIGCVYNSYQGADTNFRRCPHAEFWIGIPTLFVTCYTRLKYKYLKRRERNYETLYNQDENNNAYDAASVTYGSLE